MKRSPLGRRVPLARTTSLGLRRRTKPAVPPAVRAALVARSQGQCEAALLGCVRIAVDPHHRVTVKMGGRPRKDHDRLSNLVHLCRTCHQWVTARPAESYDLGLSLREWQDPAAEPVTLFGLGYAGFPVLLTDDGRHRLYGDFVEWDGE